jgi:hypothetical protein
MFSAFAVLSCLLALDEKQAGPLIYKNQEANVILVVESNKQRVTCLNLQGELLWHQDFAEQVKKLMPIPESLRKKNFPEPRYEIIRFQKPTDNALRHLKTGSYVIVDIAKSGAFTLDLKTGKLSSIGRD